jgi:hypothetical protein
MTGGRNKITGWGSVDIKKTIEAPIEVRTNKAGRKAIDNPI